MTHLHSKILGIKKDTTGRTLWGGFLRNHDFSGETKNCLGDWSFELTLIFYEIKM